MTTRKRGNGPDTGPKRHTPNLETIVRAAKAGRLALLEVRERATGETRTALVAVGDGPGGDFDLVPFALMLDGNPYELLDPPNPDGGFHEEAQP